MSVRNMLAQGVNQGLWPLGVQLIAGCSDPGLGARFSRQRAGTGR